MTPITDKINQLPDGKLVSFYEDGGWMPLFLTTTELKALVSDLETAKRALDSVLWMAQGHEHGDEMCRLCLIEGYASGRLEPIPEAAEQLQAKSE